MTSFPRMFFTDSATGCPFATRSPSFPVDESGLDLFLEKALNNPHVGLRRLLTAPGTAHTSPTPLQPQPPAQRPGEGQFVHEFEVAAEGHAAGQTGDYKVGEIAKHAR